MFFPMRAILIMDPTRRTILIWRNRFPLRIWRKFKLLPMVKSLFISRRRRSDDKSLRISSFYSPQIRNRHKSSLFQVPQRSVPSWHTCTMRVMPFTCKRMDLKTMSCETLQLIPTHEIFENREICAISIFDRWSPNIVSSPWNGCGLARVPSIPYKRVLYVSTFNRLLSPSKRKMNHRILILPPFGTST